MPSKKKARRRVSHDSSDEEEEQTHGQTIDFKIVKRNNSLKHNFEELIQSDNFDHPELLGHCEPKDFNAAYFERTGLDRPLLFHCDPHELGMKMPNPENFGEDDVLELVGGNREVDAVVVADQSPRSVTLEALIDYYKNPEGRDLTNMLSLEFSHTKLRDLVDGPAVVSELDWLDLYFPDNLNTRTIIFRENSRYTIDPEFPAVQRFCLLSTSGCYTDFHVDFGGTSVWYHVLKGEKHFFLIPPTDQNLTMYDQWQRNYDMSTFFGNIVEKCVRITIKAGETAILPSGWIHGVYTPVKSLVFGGNFLHSFSADMQLKISDLEQKLKVAMKYRYPVFEPIHFFVIGKIVEECTGRQYVGPIPRHPGYLRLGSWLTNGKREKRVTGYVGRDWIANMGHHMPITWKRYNALNQQQKKLPRPVTPTFPTDDPLVFYDKPQPKTDAKRKCHTHKDPLPLEPVIQFKQDGLDKITKLLLLNYESILQFFLSKKCVELHWSITRPSSLLYSFQAVLQKRREQLAAQGVDLPPPPNIYTPPVVIPQLNASPIPRTTEVASPESDHSVELGDFEDSTMDSSTMQEQTSSGSDETKPEANKPDTALEEEINGEKTDIAKSVETKDEQVEEKAIKSEEIVMKEEPETEGKVEKKEEPEIEGNVEEKEEPEVEGKVERKEQIRGEKTPKTEKTPKARKNSSADRKRKTAGSFENALSPKPKKKHDPKKDKPEFVGGIPVTPMSGPAVPNEYHYDPMNEITRLGQGQLRSAYRKSQFNIEPPKQTKIYKLEHKASTETEPMDEESEQHHPEPFFSERALPRAPGTSFIPDFPPIPATPSKSPMELYSPSAPRLEMERRFSVGSSDRTPNDGAPMRDRATSFDMTRNPATPESSPINRVAKREDVYDLEYFLKVAPALVDQLDQLTKRHSS